VSEAPSGISHGEVASTHDTTQDNLVPPGQRTHQEVLGAHPAEEVARLGAYLSARFPEELTRSNLQQPESYVQVAIRLLDGLSAHVPPSQKPRCETQYCNKPLHHTDGHGWIHFG
jgi:hypothetical protein